MMVISNIKAKFYIQKLRATRAENSWVLFLNEINKFQKVVQMWALLYISNWDTDHSSKNRYCPTKIGMSGIPSHNGQYHHNLGV
jgi:hypothetical protein